MQYKCEFCQDTGSLNQDDNLDCARCDAADDRVALNAFVRSLGVNLALDERTWAIHQRALAMAPKQEAQEASNFELQKLKDAAKRAGMAGHFIDGKLRDDMFIIGRDFIDRLHAELTKLCPPIAAPAAANGAMTDEQIMELWEEFQDMPIRVFARAILAASGTDAALVKALEMAVQQNECDMLMTGEECRQCRAALSGAKGN